jgi:hypothetical protein
VAVRSTLLSIGDENAAGTRPISELTAINATFDDVQTDCFVWNIQAQAWQNMQPGVNTNTNSPGSDRWSFESRWREGLRTKIPTGNVYVIKFVATDSTLTFHSAKPCWFPLASSSYAAMITQVTAAAAAAAPDTLRIDAASICVFVAEVLLQKGWRSYGEKMRELIDLLRADLAAIPGVAVGSLRGDAGLMPVTIVQPHGEFSTGYTDDQKAIILSIRTQCDELANETDRVSVLPTLLAACTDGLKFDAASLATLGFDMAKSWYAPVPFDDSALPEAALVISLGDSILDGSGPAPHPAHLTGAMVGANIWVPYKGVFEAAQIGVNNLISLSNAFNLLGPEMVWGEMFRAEYGEVWMVKGTLWGGYATSRRERALLAFNPLRDIWRNDFDPGTRHGMFDAAIRGWLPEAVRQLRAQSKKPRVRAIFLELGTNDILSPASIEAAQVVSSLKRIIDYLRFVILQLGIGTEDFPKVVVCVPAQGLDAVPGVAPRLERVRSDLRKWALEDTTIKLQDMTGYPTNDGLHLNTAGTLSFAKDAFATWRSTADATVQPLFVPSKLMLTKALRLSKISKNNDALSQIDEAISVSRVELYKSLGVGRVTAILGMAYTTNPITANDHTRMLASTVETKMVKRELIRTMPMMFMDGSNAAQAWSEEAAFREGSYLQTRDELRRLEDDIRSGLTLLLSDATYAQADVVFPDTFHSPGSTVYGEVI